MHQLTKYNHSSILLIYFATMMIGATSSFAIFNNRSETPSFWISSNNKRKGVNYEVCEDKAFSSKYALVLSDGVGGTHFPSSYMADILVNTVGQVIEQKMKEETIAEEGRISDIKTSIVDLIASPLFDQLKKYQETLESSVQEFVINADMNPTNDTVYKDNVDLLREMHPLALSIYLGGAGTLTGAYIRQKEGMVNYLHIFQAGDSLAMFMKPKMVQLGSQERYFLPEFVTDDQQESFNAPKQINSAEPGLIKHYVKSNIDEASDVSDDFALHGFKKYLESIIVEYEVNIHKTDTILIGSDGLFDNIPTPLLVIFYNYVVKTMEIALEENNEIINFENLLNNLVDDYYNIAKAEQLNFFTDLDTYMTNMSLKKQTKNEIESLKDVYVDEYKKFNKIHIDPKKKENKVIYIKRSVANFVFAKGTGVIPVNLKQRGSVGKKEVIKKDINTDGEGSKIVKPRVQSLITRRNTDNIVKDNHMKQLIAKNRDKIINIIEKSKRRSLRDSYESLRDDRMSSSKKEKENVIKPIIKLDTNTGNKKPFILYKNPSNRLSLQEKENEVKLKTSTFLRNSGYSKDSQKKISFKSNKKPLLHPQTKRFSSFLNKVEKKNKIDIIYNQMKQEEIQEATELIKGKSKIEIPSPSFDNFKPKMGSSRILENNLLSESNCSLMELVHFSVETNKKYLNKVVISPCVENILKRLSVKKIYNGKQFNIFMSKALVSAAKRISQFKDILISPFAIQAARFNKGKRGVKKDDISLIVSGIAEVAPHSLNKEETQGDTFQTIFSQLETDLQAFLDNSCKVKGYFSRLK